MKYNRFSILLIVLSFAAITAAAQDDEFAFRRKINGIKGDDWYAISLPPELFQHCRQDFADLRILALTKSDTMEIPYLLDILDTEVTQHEVVLSAVNQSKQGNNYYLTFLNSGYKVNHLELSFRETNYFGTVKIEGSADRNQWFELAHDEKIFSVDNSRERYTASVINFPLTDYNYLRLTVNSQDQLTLTRAAFRLDEIKPGSFEAVNSRMNISTDKKSKRTVIDVKLDHYRPVSNISLDIEHDHDFYRQMTVETLVDSTKTERGWVRNYRMVSGNLITSFKPNQFSIPFTITDRIRLTIENYDNPPLQITNVKLAGARVQLRSRLENNETFLFYGSAKQQSPVYDIEHFREKIPVSATAATLGAEEQISAPPVALNAIFENKAWLWGILLSVVALLGFFTLRMMKGK